MSILKPPYPVKQPLIKIDNHHALPAGVKELGRVANPNDRNRLYVLLKNEGHLSILTAYHSGPDNKYFCKQFDFPLKTLSWLPKELEEFRKSPAEGGMHAGAMITEDTDVDGEMLALGSATDGYYIINRSRCRHGNLSGYIPMEINLSYELLYDIGLLALWKSLGEKLERGEL